MTKTAIIDAATGLVTTPVQPLIPATLAGKLATNDYNSVLAEVQDCHRFVDTHKRCSAWWQLRAGAMLFLIRNSQRGALETLYKLTKTKLNPHQPSERTLRRYLAFAEDVFVAVGIAEVKGRKKHLASGESLSPLLEASRDQLEFFEQDEAPEGDDLLTKINRYLKQQDADELLKRMASAGDEKALPPAGGGDNPEKPQSRRQQEEAEAVEQMQATLAYVGGKLWHYLDEEPLTNMSRAMRKAADDMEDLLRERLGRNKK
jgi:hypothetical protein